MSGLWPVPGSVGSRFLGFSCHGDDSVALELYRREPSELAVTASSVVPDLEVFEDRVGEFEACVPAAPVEQLDLHASPKGLDDGVVVALSGFGLFS